jgi:hypothetical protein
MRGCSHGFQPNRCGNPACAHFDRRPLVFQLFGSGSNSALAAKIAKDNPAQYAELRAEGQRLGLLPADRVTPRCLQD